MTGINNAFVTNSAGIKVCDSSNKKMHTFQTSPLQLKFKATDQPGEFTGLASTFGGEPDSYGDVIAPGAFTKSLAHHKANGTRPALLWQHDQTAPIGVWNSLEETDAGLLATGRLTLDVPQAKSAHALMRDGALSLSIGYSIANGGAEIVNGARLLKEIQLHEISAVAMPANHHARITSVKAFDPDAPNIREFEAAARDALGLSAREVKRLLSGGWSALIRDEQADSVELAAIAAKLQKITRALRA